MTSTCPDLQSWQNLLQGTLSEARQAELNAHLESCTACQQTLEGLVASQESWRGAADELHRAPLDPTGKLGQVMAQLKARTSQAETRADSPAGDDNLSYLQSSDQPGHLGRLEHYEILEVLGKGGFGTVFKAFDEKLRRVVAIKVLAPALAASATSRRRFIREAQAAAVIKNDHVIAIHAVGEKNEPPFLVMEFVEGISLQDKLDKQGALEVKEILRIGMQIAEGLTAAHRQGLVHRDIKPANILLENGVHRVKITDFGLARTVDDASVTASGVIAGTPMFMAPEQAAGEAVDHRADLFSLGSVLYTMCTGRPPFRASGTLAVMKRVIEETPTPIREINPEIPEWLCEIIGRLQAEKPEERLQTASEVAELLGQHLAHLQQPGKAPLPLAGTSVAAAEALRSHSAPPRDTAGASQSQPRPVVESKIWKIGDRVFAPWEDEWAYAARVQEISGDSVHVWFDDGEVAWLKAGDLRPLDIGSGSRVLGAWDQGWVYYAGMVTERDGERIHIQYDDGDEEWTTLQYICVPSGKAPVEPAKREYSPQEKALRALRIPACGLIITGILYWLTIPALFVIRFAGPFEFEPLAKMPPMNDETFSFLWIRLGIMPAVAGFLLIFAGWKMRHGEFYWLCVLGACLPIALLLEKLITLQENRFAVALGDWTALPFGTWALIVLTRRDVRAAFAGTTPDEPRRRAATGRTSTVLAITVGGLLTGLLAALVIYHWQSNKLNSAWPTDVGLGVLAYASFCLFLYWLFQRRDEQAARPAPARLGPPTPVSTRTHQRALLGATAIFAILAVVIWLFVYIGRRQEPVIGQTPAMKFDIAGEWESNWGPVTLEHAPIADKSTVAVGGYYLADGDKKAVITKGTYDAGKGRLEFSSSEPWIDVTATADLRLSSDGNKLEGTWSNSAGESGVWTMTRKSAVAKDRPINAAALTELQRLVALQEKNVELVKNRFDAGAID